MKNVIARLCLVGLLVSTAALAEQSEQFDDYVVYYNALTTDQLNPQVASAYQIRRSGNLAMLNISIHQSQENAPSKAVKAKLTVAAQNLTGQRREVEMREVEEGNAIYYLGVISVANEETVNFSITLTPEGSEETYDFSYRQKFYEN